MRKEKYFTLKNMAIVCSVEKAIPDPLQIPVDGIFQPHIRLITETTISRNCVLRRLLKKQPRFRAHIVYLIFDTPVLER